MADFQPFLFLRHIPFFDIMGISTNLLFVLYSSQILGLSVLGIAILRQISSFTFFPFIS